MLTYKDLQKLYNIKTNKYGNKKVKDGNETFDSVFEYEHWCELKLLEKAGVISRLNRQKRFVLIDKSKYGREVAYLSDFDYYNENGEYVVEDCKSIATKTPLYKLKKRLLAERYGIIIKEIMK